MTLNFKASIVLLVFLTSLLIYGCEQDDDLIAKPDVKTQNHEFFKRSKSSNDEFKSYIINCLAHVDDSISFTGDFVKTYGLPQWDSGMSFANEDYNSLIIPIYDKENKAISALYYIHYKNEYIKTFILLNDESNVAYEHSKRIIQYFEKTLNLETSNKEFDIVILSKEDIMNNTTKSAIEIDYLDCTTRWYNTSTGDFSYYWYEEECSIETDYFFEEHHSGGGWATSNGGNYSTNSSYGGGNGGSGNNNGTDPEPYPEPAPPIIEDDSWTGTKADCVKDKLEAGGSNSILNKLLNGFELDKSNIDLTFYVGNTDYNGNPIPNGKCLFNNIIGRMSVYISENRLAASSLEIARTILHECFHAYMYGNVYEYEIHNGLAPDPDFLVDFNNYRKVYGYDGGSNSAQHNYMATMYIQFMKEGLKNFFNSDSQYLQYENNNSSNDNWDLDSMLEGLAWQGLHGTDAWMDFKNNNSEKVNDFDLQISLFVNDYEFPKDCD